MDESYAACDVKRRVLGRGGGERCLRESSESQMRLPRDNESEVRETERKQRREVE